MRVERELAEIEAGESESRSFRPKSYTLTQYISRFYLVKSPVYSLSFDFIGDVFHKTSGSKY